MSGRAEETRPPDKQLDFDLGKLRASLKRRREAAGGLQASQQGSKKGRFEAASLQVSSPFVLPVGSRLLLKVCNQISGLKRRHCHVCDVCLSDWQQNVPAVRHSNITFA